MRISLPHVFVGFFAVAGVLAPAAALAFKVEDRDADGQYSVPKFDLEEQAKNFRKDGGTATATGNGYSIPLGNGSLEFGVRSGSGSAFNSGSVFSRNLGPGSSAESTRQEFDRRLAPPTSLEYNGVR
jgi:hypothetical protein